MDALAEGVPSDVMAHFWRHVEATALSLIASGAVLGWVLTRSRHPILVGGFAFLTFTLPLAYRRFRHVSLR